LAAVVQTRSRTLVFDTGPKFSSSFDTGRAVVIPFLRHKNINKIDMLIVSHEDNDHRGGASSVQDGIRVDKLLSSFPMQDGKRCLAGQHWNWDGVEFEMLNPAKNTTYRKRNNASCVLRIKAGEDSVLLSGDIEKKAEKQLVELYTGQLESTYLVSPHHGSKTSSSERFLKAVNPEYVFIPVGYKNRYRMPHKTVISRYQEMNIPILQTFRSGAISLRFGQKSSSNLLVEYRQYQKRYWHSQH
jgi:competence protein ComEC